MHALKEYRQNEVRFLFFRGRGFELSTLSRNSNRKSEVADLFEAERDAGNDEDSLISNSDQLPCQGETRRLLRVLLGK